jgi:hypothetical protein
MSDYSHTGVNHIYMLHTIQLDVKRNTKDQNKCYIALMKC